MKINDYKMKLLKSELKVFGSACDATADLFIALDESFCIQFTNKFAERVLLHNQESLQDRSFIDYLKINQLPLFLDNCIKSKHSESINLNGFFIRWKVYAGTLDGLKSFFLIGENITEQEQLYLAVEEECRKIMGHDFPKRLSIPQYINEVRNYLTSIINKIPCYVYWKGKDLKYRGCNELGAKFLNISSSAEIIGKTDLELFSNKVWPKVIGKMTEKF